SSVAAGLRAALAAGAVTTPNMSTFYGHTMPAVPADPPPAAWTSVTQYATGDAIIINERGERFFDESRSLADELASSEIIQQPNGRAFLLVDDRLYRDAPRPGSRRSPNPRSMGGGRRCRRHLPRWLHGRPRPRPRPGSRNGFRSSPLRSHPQQAATVSRLEDHVAGAPSVHSSRINRQMDHLVMALKVDPGTERPDFLLSLYWIGYTAEAGEPDRGHV